MLQLRRWRRGSRRGKLAARLIMPLLPRLRLESLFVPPFDTVTIWLCIKQILRFPNRETECTKSPQKFRLSWNRVRSRFTTKRLLLVPYRYWVVTNFRLLFIERDGANTSFSLLVTSDNCITKENSFECKKEWNNL